jgi:hypothetical protein
MHNDRAAKIFEPSGARGELVRLVRRIKALRTELEELRRHTHAAREVETKERTPDQLHWRLANVARRTATELDNVA